MFIPALFVHLLTACGFEKVPAELLALLFAGDSLWSAGDDGFSSAPFVARRMSLREAGGGQVTGALVWAFAVGHQTAETSQRRIDHVRMEEEEDSLPCCHLLFYYLYSARFFFFVCDSGV